MKKLAFLFSLTLGWTSIGFAATTILCDYGNRYQSKLFNPVFLENKGLPVPEWLVI